MGAIIDQLRKGRARRQERRQNRRKKITRTWGGLLLIKTLLKEKKNMDFSKLKSRKLWMTVGGTAVVSIGTAIGMKPELAQQIVALIATYVLGQGIADHGAKGGSQGGEL